MLKRVLSWFVLLAVCTGSLSPGFGQAFSSSDLQSATIDDLRKRIKKTPTDPDLHVSLGNVLESMGDLTGAIQEYTEALRLNPQDSKIFFALSQARRNQRDREVQSEQSSIQQDQALPSQEPSLQLGQELLKEGKLAEAITQLRLGLNIEPGAQGGRLHLAESLLLMGEVDGALGELQALIRTNPTMTEAYLRLGATLMVKQDWAAAKKVFGDVLRLDPTLVEAHYNLGIVNYTMGDVEAALVSYRQALQYHPDFADAHFRLGLLLKMTGKPNEAVSAFQAAAEKGLPRAEYFLGKAYRHGSGVKQDLSIALHWLFLASDHGVEQARIALAQLRGNALGRQGKGTEDPQKLMQAFQEFRQKMWTAYPNLGKAQNGKSVGLTLLKMGRLQEAIPPLIQEAAALSEESHDMLAMIYEEGIGIEFPPYNERILAYFEQTAGEGLPGSRMVLAQIYGKGLGVPSNPKKAIQLLQGHSHPAAQRLRQQLARHVSIQ